LLPCCRHIYRAWTLKYHRMSVFDLNEQNRHLDNKIVAGLERLSQVFRTLLWEKAREQGLSPLQVQLLLFMQYHEESQNNVSYLAAEFSVTKPTISDAIKILEQKKLIRKLSVSSDSRRYSMQLTAAGRKVVRDTENFTAPFSTWISQVKLPQKELIWKAIADLIRTLNQTGVITVQRTCYTCRHNSIRNGMPFCNLLNEKLTQNNIRIDCPEYTPQEQV